MAPNYIIYALGKRGTVQGSIFIPYREKDGAFPLFSEELMARNDSIQIQESRNKIRGLIDINEAVALAQKGGYRWRLKDYESGQVNIFRPEHIVIRPV